MSTYQWFCMVQDVMDDLGMSTEPKNLVRFVRSASQYIARKIGNFIPVTEIHEFYDAWGVDLWVDALLAVTTLVNYSTTLTVTTDYVLFPREKRWPNGPYSRIHLEYSAWTDEVVLTGKWGLYDLAESTGLSASQATTSETTLVLTNGSKLSPGAIVLIESELEAITAWGATSAATSKVNGAILATDETIVVDNGAEFNAGEIIQIGTEDLYIKLISGNTLAVARGWNGTVKAAHIDDSTIAVYRTYTVERGINGTTAAAHSSKTVYQQKAPDDVHYLAREMAALAFKKSQTGYTGRAGNDQIGETFYINEFPQAIKDIAHHYRIGLV